MSEVARLEVSVAGKDVGLDALLSRIETRLAKLGQGGGNAAGAAQVSAMARLAEAAARIEVAQTRVAVAEQRVAQAGGQSAVIQQRLATEQNRTATTGAQAAVAAQNLATAEAKTVSALAQAESAQNRAAQSALRLQQAQERAASGGGSFAQQFGSSVVGSLTAIAAPAALATAALGAAATAAQSFGEAFKFKADLDATNASIRLQLAGVRDSNQVFAEGQAFAARYSITQADLTSTLQASVGVMRQSTASTTDLLSTLSRLQVLAPEKPISEAARALRELQSGDTTSIKELFNIAAKDANKMKAEIQGGADAVQVVAKYLDGAGVGMDALAAKTQGAAGKMRDLALAQEELKLSQAAFAQGPGLALLNEQITLTRGGTRLLSGDFQAMGASLSQSLSQIGGFTSLPDLLGQAFFNAAQGAQTAAAATDQATQAAAANAPAVTAEATAAALAAQRHQEQAIGVFAADSALRLQSQTLVDQTEKTFQSGIQAQNLANFQNTLAQLGGAVAAGLATAGNAAAQLAGMYGIATQSAYALIAAQAQLGQAKLAAAGLADQRAGERAGGTADTSASLTRRLDGERIASQKLVTAQNAYRDATESSAQRVARLRGELAGLTKGTAVYIEKQTELARAESAAEKGGKGKKGGAPKLTDQQRLNNTLAADQLKADQDFERAELDHQKRLLSIEADFQKKSLAQQKENEVGKRQSRFSFYSSLSQATKAIGQGNADALAAGYEEAFRRAQELSQAGNAKLAADFLKLRQQQLQDDLSVQQDLAKAKEDKDKGEIARIQALEDLRKQAQAEETKNLLEGGDANVNARSDALADENKRIEEQLGTIADKTEAATQRKVAAAQRSGKAISAENLELEKQSGLLDQINTKSSGAAATGTTGTTGTTAPGAATSAPAATGAPAAPIDLAGALAALGDRLEAKLAELVGVGRDEVGATRDVAGRISSLGPRLVQ